MAKLLFNGGCVDGQYLELDDPPYDQVDVPYQLPPMVLRDDPRTTLAPYGVHCYELRTPNGKPWYYDHVGARDVPPRVDRDELQRQLEESP